jgi:hypothetical protein
MRVALFLLALVLAAPGVAQPIPACGPGQAGGTACLSGKLCVCRFERGGSITGTATGHRWDCGINRPACGEALNPPAAPNAAPQQPFMPELLFQQPWPPPGGRAR